jgi:hypothetical protein
MLRHRLERKHGRYEGRAKLPAIGQKYGGDFAMWLRDSWSEIVGTQGVVAAHHARGVDVAVAFWTDEVARTKDRAEVAAYLAGESAKRVQKRPPDDFGQVGRYYGYVGFKPQEATLVVSDAVAYELELRLSRLVRWRIQAKRAKYGHKGPIDFDRRRMGNGVQALGVRPADVPKLLERCVRAAMRRQARRGGQALVWGPSYAGMGPELLAQIGGEDPEEWARQHAEERARGKECGCSDDELCEDCAPEIVIRRWEAGCACKENFICPDCHPEVFDDMCA